MTHNAKAMKRVETEKNQNAVPSSNFFAQPLPSDKFHWHFTLLGVKGTPFEGGIFHGQIKLPATYPLAPPDFYFLNENGRFKENTKICLNNSSYHAAEWTPLWNIRVMLEAINAYFEHDEGGIGSVVCSADQRRKIASKSRNYSCQSCGKMADIEKFIQDSLAKGTSESTQATTQRKEEPK